ncbi:MAG: SurA N-terminal domain-containing protein [Alphaproteobacteria bacterium]
MLQALRKSTKSWAAKGLLLVLAAAFGLWGISDIFRGGSLENTVASIGDFEISVAEFDRQLRSEIRNQSSRLGTDITLEEARNLGLTQVVLDEMMDRTALDVEVAKLGLTVDDDTVVIAIRSMPQFQAPGGTFSRALFQEVLSQNGFNEQTFELGMRRDMARTQLVGSIANWFAVSPTMASIYYTYRNQRRTMEYVVLTPAPMGAVRAPSESDLVAYYRANAGRFSTPEYRELEYVPIEVEQFIAQVAVSEEELKKEYETNRETYIQPERRDIEQIAFPSRETAEAAHRRMSAGGSFIEVARGMGLSEEDLKLGTFAKSGLDERLADSAFSIREGEITRPVQGPFGWVILRVTKVTPGVNRTFEELRETLRNQLAKGRATEIAIEAANAFEDARAGGGSLSEAAQQSGLKAIHIPAVDRNGFAPDGNKVSLPNAAKFLPQVFAAEPGEEGDTIQADDEHTYAIRIVGVRPPSPKPLEQIRDQVSQQWRDAERAKALAARAKTLAQQAQSRGSLSSVAQALGAQLATSEPLRRDSASETFSAPVLAELFSSPSEKAVYGPLAKGEGYVIARVTSVQNPDPNTDKAGYQENTRQLAQFVVGDLIESLSESLRVEAGRTINQAAYNRVIGGSQ